MSFSLKQIYKPGSVLNGHLSSTYIAICLKPPIQKMTSSLNLLLRCCSKWGLHWPNMSPYWRWALTSPFHPYHNKVFLSHCLKMAVIFCCTFLKVSLTGRYPALLLCGARTFLVRCFSTLLYATIRFTLLLFYYFYM